MRAMQITQAGWELRVERGPDWLFIRVRPGDGSYYDAPEMAERLWEILNTHFVYRLVLEMDDVAILPSHLMGQLVMLQKRVLQHDGALRLCHLQPACQDVLRLSRLESVLPNYGNREEAVLGRHLPKPR